MIETRNLYRSEEAAKFILPLKKTPVVKRKKNFLRLLALLALMAAVIVPAYFAAGSTASSMKENHMFSIRRVNVRGVDGMSSQAVKDALSALNGRSLWSLSADDVDTVVSAFGFVEGFLMKKQYPSEVTIEIRQRKSAGTVKQGSKVYEMDGNGYFWELESIVGGAPELKGNCLLSDMKLQSLVGEICRGGTAGTFTSIEPQEPGSFILTTKDGKEIVVFAEDFSGQWAKYMHAEDWITRNIRAGGRIDLRWSNRVVLVPCRAPQEEVVENGKA